MTGNHPIRLFSASVIGLLFGQCVALAQEPAAVSEPVPVVRPVSKIGASAVFDAIDQGDLESSLEVFGSFVDQTDAEDFGSNLDLPAVAAAIYRLLSQLDADERYELLKDWTLPDDDRLTIRQLTSMVPQSAPPKEFARLLGERPSEASFAMAEINGIRSLFSSGWLLAKSAEDSGRRRSLEAELEPLVEQEIAGARSLLTLVKLAADRVDAEPLAQLLLDRRSVIEAAIADGNESVSASAMAIAAAALKHEELQAVAENVFSALEEQTLLHGVGHIRAFVRMARVTALQHSSGESAPEILHRNRLLHWVPAESTTRASSSRGYSSPIWLTHEDHILHLAGEGNNDVLFFRYPLVGEFSLTCESQVGGRIKTGGGLVYGGLAFRAYRYNTALTILDADSRHTLRMPCPFVRPGTVATFNRLALRSSADHWSYEVNHRPVWSVNSTDTSPHSPWVGLSAVAGRRPFVSQSEDQREPQNSSRSRARSWRCFARLAEWVLMWRHSQTPLKTTIPIPSTGWLRRA